MIDLWSEALCVRVRFLTWNGAVRAIMEAVGVRDVLAKAIGTNNPHNVLRATLEGLRSLRSAEEVSAIRGKKLEAPRK